MRILYDTYTVFERLLLYMSRRHSVSSADHNMSFPASVIFEPGSNMTNWTSLFHTQLREWIAFTWSTPQTTVFKWSSDQFPGLHERFWLFTYRSLNAYGFRSRRGKKQAWIVLCVTSNSQWIEALLCVLPHVRMSFPILVDSDLCLRA